VLTAGGYPPIGPGDVGQGSGGSGWSGAVDAADGSGSDLPSATTNSVDDPSRHGLLSGPLAIAQVVGGAVDQAADLVKPGAAVAVATGFGFPLGLMLLVLLFLVIQNRLDHRDPKLRAAPLTHAETTVAFEEEESL